MAASSSFLWMIFSTCLICISSVMEHAQALKDKDYVDPTDILNFDPVNMRMKDDHHHTVPEQPRSDLKTDVVSSSEHCSSCCERTDDSCKQIKEKYDTATTLLRQYTMSLVRLMESKVASASKPTLLDLRVTATYHSLAKLRKFGEGANLDFHILHETLTSLMQYARPVPEETGLSRFYWLEDKMGLSLPMMAYVTLLVVACLLIVVTISKLKVSRQLIWRSIFVIFIISVILTMIEMYQGKVAEQEELLLKSMKEHCPKAEDMSVWERVYSYATSSISFENDDCKRFMKAMLVNPLVTVSPMEAVAVAVVKTVVTPMDLIGQGIKNFLVGLLKGLPLQLQIFVLICLVFLMIFLPLLILGYNLSFLGLINIGPQRVIREVQYIQSDSLPKADRRNQHPDVLYPGHASQSGMLRNTFEGEPSITRDSSGRLLQPLASNYAAEDGVRSNFTTSQSSIQALQSNINTQGKSLLSTSGQADSGDGRPETIPKGNYENVEISSGLSRACGDGENTGPDSADLCYKLKQVSISQTDSCGKDEEHGVDHEAATTENSDGNKNLGASADHNGDSASGEVASRLQNLNLNEGANLADPSSTSCAKNDLESMKG